jgi:hypothetical protein
MEMMHANSICTICIAASKIDKVQKCPEYPDIDAMTATSMCKKVQKLQGNCKTIDPFAPLQGAQRNTKWQSSFAKSTPKGSVADRHGSRHQKCLDAKMKVKDAHGLNDFL